MGSRIGSTASVVLLVLVFGAGQAGAWGGGAMEVAQPLVTWERIEVSRVTYVMGRPFSLIPGYNLIHLGKPSCACNERGESENYNAASFLGIRAGFDPHHGATSELFGDTLKVFMDLSGLRPACPELEGMPVEVVVRATVECVLTTAYDCRFGIAGHGTGERVEARFVHLEVRGSDKYSHLGRVFSFEELGPLPRKRYYRHTD